MITALTGIAATWLLAATAAPSAGPASAQPAQPACTLTRMVSLPMSTEPEGTVSIPVSLNGHPLDMEVDTGSIVSSISKERAREFGLEMKLAPVTLDFINNVPMQLYVQLDTVRLGNGIAKSILVYVAPSQVLPLDISGLFGPDFMARYDVEFDFAAGMFKVFQPNSCTTPPVYWTHTAYAEVALTVERDGHISVPATLDGSPLAVAIDTGSPGSTMSLQKVRALFSLADDDPRLVSVKPERINGAAEVSIYRFPFRTLSFGGVQVNNPDIDIIPQSNFGSGPPLILGMSVLRHLHLFIGYKAQELYLTAAEAR